MNVNNYYSYFVDPTFEKIQKKLIEAKKKKIIYLNCKKSQCLKLYCNCFANGEFCVDCKCQGCSNVIGNEIQISKAFKEIVAMKFNITEESIPLGCNCTKSNCLKKYCECYKANLSCTESCRCRDCDNCSKNINILPKPSDNNSKPVSGIRHDNYSFQKISIMIDSKKINIQRTENIPTDKFLIKKPKDQVFVRIKNYQTFIEIPKSLITLTKDDSTLPFLNKKRVSDRNSLNKIEKKI